MCQRSILCQSGYTTQSRKTKKCESLEPAPNVTVTQTGKEVTGTDYSDTDSPATTASPQGRKQQHHHTYRPLAECQGEIQMEMLCSGMVL